MAGKSLILEFYLVLERLNQQTGGQLLEILVNNPDLDVTQCPLCGGRGFIHLSHCHLATPQPNEQPQPGRKPKIRGEQKLEILQIAVERGRTMKELCEMFGVRSRATMCRTLRENGLWERYQQLKQTKTKGEQ